MPTLANSILETQRELFEIIDEFFTRATGEKSYDFAEVGAFGKEVRKHSSRLAQRGSEAFIWAHEALADYYGRNGATLFRLSKDLSGAKLVLGGTSRFGQTQLKSVRKMVLYADTILIADPLLPWIETERSEERFKNVLLLETVHTLLALKPLIDSDLADPPIVVFPSWEKTLEEKDSRTQASLDSLATEFLSHYLAKDLESLADVFHYVQTDPQGFLDQVQKSHLFVAPGCEPNTGLSENLKSYREEIQRWRAPEWTAASEQWNDGELVLNGIRERLVPQYHLLENADELSAEPMICIEAQWHYFILCARALEKRLESQALLESETIAAIRAMNFPQFNWLGNVSTKDLVRLRQNGENEEFRRAMRSYLGELREVCLDEMDKVVRQVSRGISALIANHQREIEKIQRKYDLQHSMTGVAAAVTLAVKFYPILGPVAGVLAPSAVLFKYLSDRIHQTIDLRRASRSLIGVLATAAKSPG